jgi:endonuclease YncB( thermonuclease family)
MGYSDPLSGPIDAEVIKVVDGDTIKVRANIWVDQTVIVSYQRPWLLTRRGFP